MLKELLQKEQELRVRNSLLSKECANVFFLNFIFLDCVKSRKGCHRESGNS